MEVYAIAGTTSEQREQIRTNINRYYEEKDLYLLDNIFFVASDGDTSQSVATKAGIGSVADNLTGVIIQVRYYGGYHDRGLWEWIDSKFSANGRR